MENKKWYLSKTVWAGVITVLVTGYNAASEQFSLPKIPEFAYILLGSLGVYGRVDAKGPLSK